MREEWKASAYAENSKGQAVWAKELIEKMALKGDESILDIGCGDGKITDTLCHRTGGEVVGVDFSPEMIAYAKSTFTKPLFMQMDAQALSFNERFDVVFSNAALHWAKDHNAIVQGIFKALKPKGRAICRWEERGMVKKCLKYFIAFSPRMPSILKALSRRIRFIRIKPMKHC
ncbi:MAG: class I SAM-dependent methyltransferase [Sulfurospirillum cavolei]|nr:class I SAM-dependent methyltransferase [Sulfurospirillum cavolei]